MADYKLTAPLNAAAFLLTPITETIKGVTKKTYKAETDPFFCSFKTFGGTEKVVNNIVVVEDTATIETWYNPKITSDCHIRVESVEYEILGTPENINMRNQYMKFKVRAIKGGA